jgi:programmed cell death protein 5
MNDLEDIKRKKIEEIKKQQQNISNDYEIQQQIAQLESMVKSALTKKALERYGNIKTAHPELAIQLITLLGQAISTGRIKNVDDEALKNLLKRMQPKKDKFNIIRK